MKRILAIAVLIIALTLAACGEQSTGGVTIAHSLPPTATPTPWFTVATAAPTYTSPPAPTSVPTQSSSPTISTSWTQSIDETDELGYKFAVRLRTDSFAPTAPGAPMNVSAPPGKDILELHFQVTNLLRDRPASLNLIDVEIFGPCLNVYTGSSPWGYATAPNGQCYYFVADEGWAYYVPSDQYDPTGASQVYIGPGDTADFYVYPAIAVNADFTAWTLWLQDCPAGQPYTPCHLTGGVNVPQVWNGQ